MNRQRISRNPRRNLEIQRNFDLVLRQSVREEALQASIATFLAFVPHEGDFFEVEDS